MPEPLPKQYRPAEHEDGIMARWEDAGAFEADPARVDAGAKPYCILMPPPNVTAPLHLGHAFNGTIQDILIRAHRMMGFETLWMPGTDHAGIATQTVVDKRLKSEGKPALADYKKIEADGGNGREDFVALVQAWKDEYEAKITDQFRAIGCSADWRRQRFTMDDLCARAVREAFFRLFRDGLIYRGKRLVNWDPVTLTALADDEVEDKEIAGFFFYMTYPVVDDAGAETGESVTVATTRPETYLGDTAVAVNPDDPERARFIGKTVKLPLVGRLIPVIGDDYVVKPDPDSSDNKAKYASGFLKVTPAHDPNDWEIGQRHDLDIINVMAPDASISDQHGWTDVGDAGRFLGMSREDARKAVVAWFKEQGLLADQKDYAHSVGHSYRSHVPIEPYLSDQWYCKVTDDRLRGSAQRAIAPRQRSEASLTDWPESKAGDAGGDGKLTFYPDRYAKTYESWHDNLRDWCISRQLWWGHRIPVWSNVLDLASDPGAWMQLDQAGIAEEEFSGKNPNIHIRVIEVSTGETLDVSFNDLATGKVRTIVSVHICTKGDTDTDAFDSLGIRQDPDVLDTWFSSALWPLSTMGWPDPDSSTELADAPADSKDLLQRFNTSAVLCTAREIITLWVSRMVMFNRYFLGQDDGLGEGKGRLPYDDVFIHAMIQDGDGRKMSKSLGNGVDPFDIIHSHGADAMRFTLAKMATHTQDVRMPVEPDPETGKNTSPKFDEGRNFCNKLWNAARFTLTMLERDPPDGGPFTPGDLSLADRWMLSRLRTAEAEVREAIGSYSFAAYAQSMYDLLWRDFCDWYLEAIKPQVADNPGTRATLRASLETILRLLHPIAPFVTETIHESVRTIDRPEIAGLGFADAKHGVDGPTLCQSGWPEPGEALADAQAEAEFEWVRSLVRAINETRAAHRVEPKRRITLHVPGDIASRITKAEGLVGTLGGLATVTTDEPDGASAAFTLDATELRLGDLADAVNEGAERERLEKRAEELTKSIGALEGRLGNPGYTDKAPAHLVEQTRGQLDQAKDELETVRTALGKLG